MRVAGAALPCVAADCPGAGGSDASQTYNHDCGRVGCLIAGAGAFVRSVSFRMIF